MLFVPGSYLTLADAVVQTTARRSPELADAFAKVEAELKALEDHARLVRGAAASITLSGPGRRLWVEPMTPDQLERLAGLRTLQHEYQAARTAAVETLQRALGELKPDLHAYRLAATGEIGDTPLPASRWRTAAGRHAIQFGGVPEADGRVSRKIGECVLIRQDAFAAWLDRAFPSVTVAAYPNAAAASDIEGRHDLPQPSPSEAFRELVAHLRSLAKASPTEPTHTTDKLWKEIQRHPRWRCLVTWKGYMDARKEAFEGYPEWTRRGIRRRGRK